MSNDSETFDPKIFIKQLAPDQLGLFEPLSSLMLLNVSDADFKALGERAAMGRTTSADRMLVRTMIHERYHYGQVIASGYCFHRQAKLLMIFNANEPPHVAEIPADMRELIAQSRLEAGDDHELNLRIEQVVALYESYNQLNALIGRADEEDPSLYGAFNPGFFAYVKQLADLEIAANSEGISITGLIEGSAVVHTNLLFDPKIDPHEQIIAELRTLPPIYHELLTITEDRVGERALELLLPAAALALRYIRPHNAYLPLLTLLAASPPGEAFDRGRALAAALPEIAEAGPVLGTALDVRDLHDGYRIYDEALEKLRSGVWGVDSYELLARPAAMFALGKFPGGIITRDGWHPGISTNMLGAQMVIMGAVLRTASRVRAERDFCQAFSGWGQGVFGRMFSMRESHE
jgi:hypothetical protein